MMPEQVALIAVMVTSLVVGVPVLIWAMAKLKIS